MATNTKQYNRKNYRKYRGSKEAIAERSSRNKARRKMKLKVGDPKEVDHKRGVKAGNGKSNLRVISRKKNRQLGAAKANRNKRRKK